MNAVNAVNVAGLRPPTPARPSTVLWATLLLYVCAGLSLINAVPLFLPAAYARLPADVMAPTAVLLALVSAGIVGSALAAAPRIAEVVVTRNGAAADPETLATLVSDTSAFLTAEREYWEYLMK